MYDCIRDAYSGIVDNSQKLFKKYKYPSTIYDKQIFHLFHRMPFGREKINYSYTQ